MKKTHRYILLFLAIIINALFLSGCWDQRELDELVVPFIIGYDYADEEEKEQPDDRYLISAGFPVFYEDTLKKYHVDITSGSLDGEVISRRNTHFGEQIIQGQLQIVVLGEELISNENIMELTDILSRNPAVKGAIPMAVSAGRAADMLNAPVKQYPNPGIYIQMLIKNIRRTNFFPTCSLFESNRHIISNHTASLLPYIVQKDGNIMFAGSCLLNEGKRMEHLNSEETEIAVMLRGIRSRGMITYDIIEDNKAIDQVTFEGKNRRKVKVKKDGDRYIFNILIKLSGRLFERKKNEPVIDHKDFIKLSQKSLEDLIRKRAEDLIIKVQEEYGFDALELGMEIKAHSREKMNKEDIDRIIQESEINVEVKVQIENAGGKI